jgi:hypothetical protein
MDFWHTAQPESFGGILAMVALLVACRPGHARAFASGLLFGLVALCKPTLAGPAAVVALWLARETWLVTRSLGRAAVPAALLAAGAAVPILACVAWLAAGGALDAAREIFTGFAPAYTRLGWAGHDGIALAWRAFVDWGTYFSSVLCVGMLLLLGLAATAAERRGAVLVALVVAAQLVGLVLQAKYYAYHFGALWPPTALLAALGWCKLLERARARGLAALLGAAALLAVAAVARTAGPHDLRHGYGKRLATRLAMLAGERSALTDELDSVFAGDAAIMHAAVLRDAAARIRDAVPPDRALYVWGFEPGLHDLTGRRAPTRYFYNQALRMTLTAPAARAELMRDLARDRPGAIVLVKRDGQADVVGDSLDSHAALRTFPELDAFVKRGYRPLFELSYLTVLIDRR